MIECSLNTVRLRSLYYFIKFKYAIDYFVVSHGNIVLLQMTSSLYPLILLGFRGIQKKNKEALGGRKKSEEARGVRG